MRKLIFLPMMVVVALAAASPMPSPRRAYPISAEQVATAISQRGVSVSAAHIDFLASVVSAQPSPRLEVIALEPWGDRRAKVLISCHETAQCLPFYVALNWDEKSDAELGLKQWNGAPRTGADKSSRRQPPVIRAGQAAILMMDTGKVHLQLPVICLESGAIGGNIRVTSKDRRQIFMAEIVSNRIVKGGVQ